MVDYQSLYRRYRPQRFAEVKGQDHVVSALRHAARDSRVAHAYLFSGPRGTGKTSTARILAKALNCTNLADGEPCGTCESCLDIARGASFDVHELDAASNNGVDAMRDLVARASLATPGRWKVYIVDEVHMLSQAASNALLKTLEEPPDHVVFVLATTDPQKVLPTIRSRTQHYEFHLLDAEVLAVLLAEIAGDAELDLPETAVEAAVRRGRGSARDALSALDQVVASGVVEDDSPFLQELLVSFAERDTKRALQAVEHAHVAGRDAPRIATELLDELRGQFLAAVAPGLARDGEPPASGVSAPASPHGGLVLLLGPARTVRAMEILGAAMVAMRDALDARVTLEVAIVRLTHPEADDDPAALLERIERLERRVSELTQGVAGADRTPGVAGADLTPGVAGAGTPGLAGADRTPSAGAATSPPAARDLGSQPALGAFGPRPSTLGTTAPNAAPTPAAGALAEPTGALAEPGPPAAAALAEPTGALAEPGPPAAAALAEPTGALAEPGAPAPAALSEPTATPPPESNLAPPTRDEFVAAWGDHVLSQLRPRVRAVFAVGRFVGTDGRTAILALPNSAHVERARSQSEEVAEELGRYFGRPVDLRLVAETDFGGPTGSLPAAGPAPARPAGNGATAKPPRSPATASAGREGPGPAEAEGLGVSPDAHHSGTARAGGTRTAAEDPDDEVLDPDDLDPHGENVAGDALSWAQDRLLEAFPGAEEV